MNTRYAEREARVKEREHFAELDVNGMVIM
jgi:hypothetical protein